MFIEENEHVIIMEDDRFQFSLDDLKKLEDAGIKTIFLANVIKWNEIYTYKNWTCIDSRIEKFSKTSLKVIIPFHGKDLPEKFRWQDKDGWLKQRPDYISFYDFSHFMPDYVNPEYALAVDDFYSDLYSKYNYNSSRLTQFIYAIPDDGEFPFFPHWPEQPISNDALLDFIYGRQHELIKQYGELWTCFHNQTGLWNATYIHTVYDMLKREWPRVNRYAIQFEHFIHMPPTQLYVKKYAEDYGVRFFVGSNYVEGLQDNLYRGINQKIWGFLTAPMHRLNDTRHTKVEDWMIPVIQKANKELCEVWK